MKSKIKKRIFGASALAGLFSLAGSAKATYVNYDFEGALGGWANTVTNSGGGFTAFTPWQNVNPHSADSNSPETFDGTGAHGNWQLAPNVSTFSNPCCPQDNVSHTVIDSSPDFTIGVGGTITFAITGGAGGGAIASNFSAYNTAGLTRPINSVLSGTSNSGGGFEGVGLRIFDPGQPDDGTYVASASKSGNGESYQAFTFSAAQLAPYEGNGTRLSLDVIDGFNGGWGWVAVDNITINNITPEPASAVIFGLGALGAMTIRRRRVAGI